MSDLLLDSSDELELPANFATDGDPVYSYLHLIQKFRKPVSGPSLCCASEPARVINEDSWLI